MRAERRNSEPQSSSFASLALLEVRGEKQRFAGFVGNLKNRLIAGGIQPTEWTLVRIRTMNHQQTHERDQE